MSAAEQLFLILMGIGLVTVLLIFKNEDKQVEEVI
jgi:hypothetical protein